MSPGNETGEPAGLSKCPEIEIAMKLGNRFEHQQKRKDVIERHGLRPIRAKYNSTGSSTAVNAFSQGSTTLGVIRS